jgi:hypothetical protein
MKLANKNRYVPDDLDELRRADVRRMLRIVPQGDEDGVRMATALIDELHTLYRARFGRKKALEERAAARRQAEAFYRRKARQALLDRIPAMYDEGKTFRQISEELRIPEMTVSIYLRHRVEPREYTTRLPLA